MDSYSRILGYNSRNAHLHTPGISNNTIFTDIVDGKSSFHTITTCYQDSTMADDRVNCFNPSCPQGTNKQYSQRGISAHLSHSAECQEYVSYNNVHQSSASRPSFISVHGHLDASTTHALSTGVTLAHRNHPKRPRLLLNKAYPHTPGNEVELPVTIPQSYVDPMEHIGFAFHEDDEAASTPTEGGQILLRACLLLYHGAEHLL
jgi:hypothetical protein